MILNLDFEDAILFFAQSQIVLSSLNYFLCSVLGIVIPLENETITY